MGVAIVWLVNQIFNLMVIFIIAAAIMSWLVAFNVLNPRNRLVYAIGAFLDAVTQPLLSPFRRIEAVDLDRLGPGCLAAHDAHRGARHTQRLAKQADHGGVRLAVRGRGAHAEPNQRMPARLDLDGVDAVRAAPRRHPDGQPAAHPKA